MERLRSSHRLPFDKVLPEYSSAHPDEALVRFLRSKPSPATRKSYFSTLRFMLVGPYPNTHRFTDEDLQLASRAVDSFLKRAASEKRQTEDFLESQMIQWRESKKSFALAVGRMASARSLCQYFEVPLNWKRIYATFPKGQRISNDRAPTVHEIRALFEHGDLRLRLVVKMMESGGGFRVGAFEYLSFKDLEVLPEGIGALTIYRGEKERYNTFVDAETVALFKEYCASREKAGERLLPDSPLIRDKWAYENNGVKLTFITREDRATKIAAKSVAASVRRGWLQSGVKIPFTQGGWKQDHGLRKYFRSVFPSCPLHGRDDAEALMGHKVAYYRPTWEHLKDVYLQSMHALAISESESLKVELKTEKEVDEKRYDKMRLEVLEMKEKGRETEEKVRRLFDDMVKARLELAKREHSQH